jgi:enamine deaminase RidA (YjgF/YER057c/UK114 family)
MNGARIWHQFIAWILNGPQQKDIAMQRRAVNPWDWSLKLGYNQAEIIEGATRHVVCAGQTAVDAAGNPQHPGDMRGQINLALDNLAAVLAGAGMTLGHVTRLGVFTTDVDEALMHFDLLGMRFGAAHCAPPMTLVEVTRLAIPGLLFEIEASACA